MKYVVLILLQVFGEIGGIQKTMYTKQSVEYLEFMRNVFLPSIQCPPAIAEEYCQAIQQLNLRDFKKYFQVSMPITPF
jgi:exportin-T